MTSTPDSEPDSSPAAGPDTGPPRDRLHEPVLLDQVLQTLALGVQPAPRVLDLTLGCGGHSEAILERFPEARVVGVDRDPDALAVAREVLARFGDRATLREHRFDKLDELAGPFDAILADLGCSSLQLDRAERGFSFQRTGPLDMRMGPDARESAAELIARADAEELTRILRDYGEEPAARRIAEAVVKARMLGPIETTEDLAAIVRQLARPPRRGGRGRGKGKRGPTIDAATRSFQGLRIAVNSELDAIAAMLPAAAARLAEGGRLAVISFHSLEDRLVKRFFKDARRSPDGRARLEELKGSPFQATAEENQANPRARSAKLRVAVRRPA